MTLCSIEDCQRRLQISGWLGADFRMSPEVHQIARGLHYVLLYRSVVGEWKLIGRLTRL